MRGKKKDIASQLVAQILEEDSGCNGKESKIMQTFWTATDESD